MADIIHREARLIILRALVDETAYSLNETLIQATLETFGLVRTREWVREELRRMQDLGAVVITEAGTVMIARLTQKGHDHVDGRLMIEGIKRPSPRG